MIIINTENSVKKELAVLAGIDCGELDGFEDSTEETLDELESLLDTAGGECVARVLQNRHTPDPKTFLGEGKVQEIKELCENLGAELIVIDNELSPSQLKAIEDSSGFRVIDRSMLILDIFAQRAHTSEGKLQVELAQLKYLLPRLTGLGLVMSRQGGGASGGIGARRGGGETKLEQEKRRIRGRISSLKSDLEELKKNREQQRRLREKENIPKVAIIGYTNAGKSTILNNLTNANVLAENKLFATLDPTTRRLEVENRQPVLLTDTVGFIRKLPHHLVEAFKSTLDELCYADLLLHIVDAHSPEWQTHIEVVNRLIRELGAQNKPVLTVFNKSDLTETPPKLEKSLAVSAFRGDGMPELVNKILDLVEKPYFRLNLRIPSDKGNIISSIYDSGRVISINYSDNGETYVTAEVDTKLKGRVQAYII